MANIFLTPKIIAQEALMILRSNCVAAALVYRDYQSEFAGMKVGDTVTIRRPANFEAKEFAGNIEVQNANEKGIPLVLEKHFDVSVNLTSKDMALELESFSEQIVAPAMAAIAEKVDRYVLSQYAGVPSCVQFADDRSFLARVDRALNDQRVPVAGRNAIVSTSQKEGMFNISEVVRADARGDEGTALREASMGRIVGLDWYMDQNVNLHTSGAAGTVSLAADAASGATSVSLTLADGATIATGDIINFAGVVNPETGAEVQFIATDALAASGTVGIYPALPSAVTASAVVTQDLNGSLPMGLAFVRNAFALAVAPLEMPSGAANAAAVNFEGLAIRVVSGYDIHTKTDTISFDLLCGAKCIDPRLAVRIAGGY